jgi:hypothetical protein
MLKAGAGECTGRPSGKPVSAIAPDAAQSSTAQVSIPHYPIATTVGEPARR